MKKSVITLLALLALTLTGCKKPTQAQIDASAAHRISAFNYKGHRYLKYSDGGGDACVVGITHDPDCPCREKGEKQ